MASVPKKVEQAIAAFTARSPERDAQVDSDRIRLIVDSIDEVIEAIHCEQSGLTERVRRTVHAPNPPSVFWNLARRPKLSVTEFAAVEARLFVLRKSLGNLQTIKDQVSGLFVGDASRG